MPQEELSPTTWLEELTASQRRAVDHFEGPLLVLAGPGSGKTRVITNRVAALINKGVAACNICAVTFTNKAAEEMKQRIINLLRAWPSAPGPAISTFHSLCVRILRQYADKAGVSPNFSIYDEADQQKCITEAIKACEIDTANFPPAKMLERISLLKNKLETVDSVKDRAEDFSTRILARVYAAYQQLLAQQNGLDFDDLLLKTAFLLRDCPDVRHELNMRFKFLLVDEYQDTNHAQYQIAKHLVIEHGNICATGDPDQSIYAWRGADINNILQFEKDFPNATVVKLEENFRSTPNILELADKLISANGSRKHKILIPTKSKGPDVIITGYADDAAEAQAVAEKVQELITQGAHLNDIAVFYRVNAMSRCLEEMFVQNKIPYQVVRGVQFYNRKEIRDMLGYLKILVNPRDEVALLRIINTPARGIGRTTITRVAAYAGSNNLRFYQALERSGCIESLAKAAKAKIAAFVNMLEGFKTDANGPVAPLMKRIFTESGLADALKASGANDAAENVAELINAARSYDRNAENPSLQDYLQQIALFTNSDAYDRQKGAVALMTLHCAKGLEFKNVFIVGLEQGVLPHKRSNDDYEQLEEERRLFFVGITRAKKGLHISYAKHRAVRGQLIRAIRSRFLCELGPKFFHPEDEYESYDYDAPPAFIPGQVVKHSVFGLGTVEESIDMGLDSIVVVQFSSGQKKSLVLKYANLSRIKEIGT